MRTTWAVFSIGFLVACTDPSAEVVGLAGEGPAADGKADGLAGFAQCTGRPFTAPAKTGFRHTANKLLALTGARHRAQDVIVPPQLVGELAAKAEYGPTWKDLEDERVTMYFDNCARWVELATVKTDGDGYARLPVDIQLGAGVYGLRFVVRGDATQTAASLWVLPSGTHIAVADVDGTLTTADTELFKQIFDGDYVPAARASAAALTRAHAARGHIVTYLTGRPAWLLGITRGWLTGLDFAVGPVHAANHNTEVLPIESSVGDYKREWLDELEGYGYVLDLAYGNASTDIYAYTGAGLAPAAQWIVGDNAGDGGTNPVADSWAARTAEVLAGPVVAQPF